MNDQGDALQLTPLPWSHILPFLSLRDVGRSCIVSKWFRGTVESSITPGMAAEWLRGQLEKRDVYLSRSLEVWDVSTADRSVSTLSRFFSDPSRTALRCLKAFSGSFANVDMLCSGDALERPLFLHDNHENLGAEGACPICFGRVVERFCAYHIDPNSQSAFNEAPFDPLALVPRSPRGHIMDSNFKETRPVVCFDCTACQKFQLLKPLSYCLSDDGVACLHAVRVLRDNPSMDPDTVGTPVSLTNYRCDFDGCNRATLCCFCCAITRRACVSCNLRFCSGHAWASTVCHHW